MSYINENLKQKVAEFNKKYTCTIDLADYEKIAQIENPTEETWNMAYKETFHKAWDTAVANMYEGKSKLDFKITDMFNDFESMVMDPYRKECEKAKAPVVPKAYGGMEKKLDVTCFLIDEYQGSNISLNRATNTRKRYETGKLRIRDMREYTLTAMQKDAQNITEAEKQNIAGYIVALKAANGNRSLGWRILHPIRNNAEKKYSEMMESLLIQKFPESFMELRTGATMPPNALKIQGAAINQYQFPEKAKPEIIKENISVTSANSTEKAEIAKPVEPQPVLEKNDQIINN